MKLTSEITLVIASTLVGSTLAHASIISVNFREANGNPNQTIEPETEAGGGAGIAATNWNNLEGASGDTTSLVDRNGDETTAALSWSSGGMWGDGTADGDAGAGVGSAQLQRGYLDDNQGGPDPIEISVSGIPYAVYDAVVYFSTDTAGGEYGEITLTAGNGTFTGSTEGTKSLWGGNPDLDETNSVRVRFLEGDVTIDAPVREGATRHSVSGIQIIESTTPTEFIRPGMVSEPEADLAAGATSVLRPGIDEVTVTDPDGLSVSADHFIEIVLSPETVSGTYPLFLYNGTIGADGFSAFSLIPPTNSRINYELVDNVAAGRVDLDFTAPEALVWAGNVNSEWDSATANWDLETQGTQATFQTSDRVIFPDIPGMPAATIDLVETVEPLAVELENDTTAYTFSGAGEIAGNTAISQNGGGSLTLGSANSFTGDVSIVGGSLILADPGALGSGDGGLLIDGGSLSSAVSLGTSRRLNIGAVGSELDVPTDERLEFLGSGFQGGGSLLKTGQGTLVFSNYAAGAFGGAVEVAEGTLEMASFAFNQDIGLSEILVRSGATLLQPEGNPHALGGLGVPVPDIILEEGAVYQIDQENYLDFMSLTGATVEGLGQTRVDDDFDVVFEESGAVSTWGAELATVQKDAVFTVQDGPLDLK